MGTSVQGAAWQMQQKIHQGSSTHQECVSETTD